jgi:F0F1-type ATP synthase assembly protein I
MTADTDDDRSPPTAVTEAGVPLATVFVLVAAIAALVAVLRSGARRVTFDERYRPRTGWNAPPPETPPPGVRWVARETATAALVASGLVGTVIGAGFGWRHPARLRAIPSGIVVGLAVGSAGGFLVVCPPRLAVALSGAAVILAAALVIRLASGNTRPGLLR